MKSYPECRSYNQYNDTNVERIIKGLCNLSDKYAQQYFNSFIQYTDLMRATGDALDERGKLLNFNRNITFNDPLNVVIPTTEGIDEYEVLYDDFKRCRLGDDAYRKVLMLLSQTRNTASSVGNLTKIISDVVDADVFVGDNMDMNYITYYFLDRIPGWLEVSMHNYDILPRPAGMSTKYISAISRFFGFLIQYPRVDIEATGKVFSAFWKARFPSIFRGVVPRPGKWLPNYVYKFTNISEAHYKVIHEERVRRIERENLVLSDYLNVIQSQIKKAKEDRKLVPKVVYNEKEDPTFIYSQAVQGLTPAGYPDETSTGVSKHMLATLHSLDKRYDTLWKYQDRVLKNEHDDIRKELFYDSKTKWWYYKPEDSSGNFDPLFQSQIYQDTCGVWFAQEPLVQSAMQGYTTLRSIDYAITRHTKRLNTSPYIAKYGQILSACSLPDGREKFNYYDYQRVTTGGHTNFDPRERFLVESLRYTDPNTYYRLLRERQERYDANPKQVIDCYLIKRMLENVHQAILIWFKTMRFDARSFRAVLDFEFRNTGIVQRRNLLKKLAEDETKNPFERRYYRDLYQRYRDYLTDNVTDYDNIYNYKDTQIWKDKQWLIYLRNRVKRNKDALNGLYQATRENYNKLTDIKSVVGTTLHDTIYRLNSDIGQEYYNDYEKRGAMNNEGYSQINVTNRNIRDYISQAQRDYDRYNQNADIRRYSAEKCQVAMDACPYARGVWSAATTCMMKTNFLNRWEPGSCTESWSENCGSYYTDWQNGMARGCQTGRGWATFEQFRDIQRRMSNDFANDRDNAWKRRVRLEQERDQRTKLTERKTLRQLMQEYAEATPEIEFPNAIYQTLPESDFVIV